MPTLGLTRRAVAAARRVPGGAADSDDVAAPARARVERLERIWAQRPGVLGWLTTTDHKRIGLLYFWTTLVVLRRGRHRGAAHADAARGAEQARRSGPSTFNQLFTMHGVTMIFFFIIPMTTGAFGNYLIPLMIGARDMAFPRLNALELLDLRSPRASSSTRASSSGTGAECRLVRLRPARVAALRSRAQHRLLRARADLQLDRVDDHGATNFIVTIFKFRAPGMSFNRMPLFCFAFLAASFGLLFALPSLSADLIMLFLDRKVGIWFFTPRTAARRCSGSTCSGSSATPRSTSSSCPRSGSRPDHPHVRAAQDDRVPARRDRRAARRFIGFGVWAHHMFADRHADDDARLLRRARRRWW